jgi:hypothetical protein
MKCCEQMLKERGETEAYPFYHKLGYQEMPFNNPDGEPTHHNDRALGKYL